MVHPVDGIPNLGVLFAGRHMENSPELVASTTMHNLLIATSKRYRDQIIIIDTPPALTSFEPAILAHIVHQSILRRLCAALRTLSGRKGLGLDLGQPQCQPVVQQSLKVGAAGTRILL